MSGEYFSYIFASWGTEAIWTSIFTENCKEKNIFNHPLKLLWKGEKWLCNRSTSCIKWSWLCLRYTFRVNNKEMVFCQVTTTISFLWFDYIFSFENFSHLFFTSYFPFGFFFLNIYITWTKVGLCLPANNATDNRILPLAYE